MPTIQDGECLVWSSSEGQFVPQSGRRITFRGPEPFAGTSVVSSAATLGHVVILSTTPAAQDGGAVLALGGERGGANGAGTFAALRGAKENSTPGNSAGYLAFYTLQTGVALAERARITSTGSFALGLTEPSTLQGGYNTLSGRLIHVRHTSSNAQLILSAAGAVSQAAIKFECGAAAATKRLFDFTYVGSENAVRLRFMNEADASITQANVLVIRNNGNVGLSVATPAHLLELGADSAAKPLTSTWTVTSDERTKRPESVRDYGDGLAELLKLRPVRYAYNGAAGTPDGAEGVGLLAQEAARAMPEIVRSGRGKLRETDEAETDILSVNPHALIYAVINALREVDGRLGRLEGMGAAGPGEVMPRRGSGN